MLATHWAPRKEGPLPRLRARKWNKTDGQSLCQLGLLIFSAPRSGWGRNELGLIFSMDVRKATQLKATDRAFAAVLEAGAVVTWGDADYGGDSEDVQEPTQWRQVLAQKQKLLSSS